MIERRIEAKTPDGVADCEYFAPDAVGRPGIIIYPDILGFRATYRDTAERLCREGFTVMVPNFYYRVSKMPVFSFTPKFGEENTMKRVGELRPSASPDNFARDAGPYVDALLAQKETKGKIGAVGYCMGGFMALRTAEQRPDVVTAAASFHGSNLVTDAPDSPHLLLPRIKADLYFGFAIEDKTMPPENVEKLKAALKAAGNSWDGEVYEGARHGWCMKDHPAYNAAQSDRALENLIALFKKTLI